MVKCLIGLLANNSSLIFGRLAQPEIMAAQLIFAKNCSRKSLFTEIRINIQNEAIDGRNDGERNEINNKCI